MVKFADQYKEQQNQQWTQYYINFNQFVNKLNQFDNMVHLEQSCLLPGIYYFSPQLLSCVSLQIEVQDTKDKKKLQKFKTQKSQTRKITKPTKIRKVSNAEPRIENDLTVPSNQNQENANQSQEQINTSAYDFYQSMPSDINLRSLQKELKIDEVTLKVKAQILDNHSLDQETKDTQIKIRDKLANLYQSEQDQQENLTTVQILEAEVDSVLKFIKQKAAEKQDTEKSMMGRLNKSLRGTLIQDFGLDHDCFQNSLNNIKWSKEMILNVAAIDQKFKADADDGAANQRSGPDNQQPLLDGQGQQRKKLIENSERELQENVFMIFNEAFKAEEHCKTQLNELIHEFIKLQVTVIDQLINEDKEKNPGDQVMRDNTNYSNPISQEKFQFKDIANQEIADVFQQNWDEAPPENLFIKVQSSQERDEESIIQFFELLRSKKAFKTMTDKDKQQIKQGFEDSITSKFQPWIHLNQKLKSLKNFMITNEMALLNIINDLDQKFFLTKSVVDLNKNGQTMNLLMMNIQEIFNQTVLKDHPNKATPIKMAIDDLTQLFADLYTDGNLVQAKKILNPEKEASLQQVVTVSLFNGMAIGQLTMLVVSIVIMASNGQKHLRNKFFYLEFYQLGSLFRLIFSTIFASFIGGLWIRIWQSYGINYIHILQINYSERLNPYQLWKPASVFSFFFLLIYWLMFEHMSQIYEGHQIDVPKGQIPIDEPGQIQVARHKKMIAIMATATLTFLWFNCCALATKLRWGTAKAFGNLIIAPKGDVHFRAYLVGEILTDCVIQLEDIGKMVTYVLFQDWDKQLVNEKQRQKVEKTNSIPWQLKWWFYAVSILPYWFRMAQNLKKWLVKGHVLQKWNVLKYTWLTLAPICLVIYLETHVKGFKYAYYSLKTIGTCHKIYWDFFIDWGLFEARPKHSKTPWGLREKRKFPNWVYYSCMVYDVIGLFSWVIVIVLYVKFNHAYEDDSLASLEFYSNIMWITWFEMIVLGIKRALWVFIRVEAEYFENKEVYRDIVTVPPILSEKN